MTTLVMKFGGSSVAKAPARTHVIQHIQHAHKNGCRVVVVVSAMGRNGDPYATDTFIELLRSAGGTTSRREQDLLLSCGEVISTVLLAQSLRAHGLPALAFTGMQAGIVTDENFGSAQVLAVRPDQVKKALTQGAIAVIAGFQGASVHGEITTLGRGGSDTTAAVMAVALGADRIEIYTDVDGMKTADPRLVPKAVTLQHTTYTEAIEMAHLGAKVIHPRAVQVAKINEIPLVIRGTMSDEPGTLVTKGHPLDPTISPDRAVTGITHVPAQVYVQVPVKPQDGGSALAVFEAMASAGISLDMVHMSRDRTAFIVAGTDADEAELVLSRLGVKYELTGGFAKVSAVGGGMHGVPGIVARAFRALAKASVQIFETSDSHANVSCLIKESDVKRAVHALHTEFRLTQQPATSQTSPNGRHWPA